MKVLVVSTFFVIFAFVTTVSEILVTKIGIKKKL